MLQLTRIEEIGVLALQETWLKKRYKMPESQLEGFREFRAVRPTRKRGGCSLNVSHNITVLKHKTFSNEHC